MAKCTGYCKNCGTELFGEEDICEQCMVEEEIVKSLNNQN